MIEPIGLVVKKIGMTRFVDASGDAFPVTILQADKQQITKVLTEQDNGYCAVQVGYFVKKEKNLNKPDLFRLKKSGVAENFSKFKEFRVDEVPEGAAIGTELDVSIFESIQSVDVTGKNKGRGFQGATKRHGAHRGPMTHGSCYHRRPGSLGMRSTPGRVFKNKKMPGHMGDKKITVQNLKIAAIDTATNTIAVKGSVPGNNKNFLIIRPSIKAKAVSAS